jgi:hypothetical protein
MPIHYLEFNLQEFSKIFENLDDHFQITDSH